MSSVEHPKIEDYALIGDCHGAGLVSKAGSLDWLCVPRFDSPACFSALLGGPEHGRWLLRPKGQIGRTERSYRGPTLTLQTQFESAAGAVRVRDTMPMRSQAVDVVRIVEGLRGCVRMEMELVLRFDYGSTVPWVREEAGHLQAIAGPDAMRLRSPVSVQCSSERIRAEFDVRAGECLPFVLTYCPSHLPERDPIDPIATVRAAEQEWETWAGQSRYTGPYAEAVTRSLITLQALTYFPTGGVVAAPTSSLPETVGGSRNWDYRYCWLRDATSTLLVLLDAGYTEAAGKWREWLLRALGGSPEQLQIMYSVTGERRLHEVELPWLPGYEGSRPVRVGNAAHSQLQLDVYGELIDMMHECRQHQLENPESWALERAILEHLESIWQEPDEGIWEIRSKRRQFTHSKVMCWVAFDRGVKAIERFGLEGPLEHWRQVRERIHRTICERAYNREIGAFTQYFDTDELDASTLVLAKVGFLPARDPRLRSTVEAIRRHLAADGLIRRYRSETGVDGLSGSEACFLPCSFWLVDNLALQGRFEEATELFERLLGFRNDVGLLAEEYDVVQRRQLGNFPQALSHVALVSSAQLLYDPENCGFTHRARGNGEWVRSDS